MSEQHMPRQSLHAFNQSSRNRLYEWRLSPDLQGQGQGKLLPHSSAINRLSVVHLAIDSLQDDEDIGIPDLESDDDDQESVNVMPQSEVQDDGIIEYMHNINIMTFPVEIIRVNTQTCQNSP
jgi:hypothetical protein